MVDHIGCPACGQRIKELEADICLKQRDGRAMFFYHVRCEEAAQRFVSENDPETWNLTHRHLFWDDAS
jgi:hypothetical protein